MQDLPHHYTVQAKGSATGSLIASADNLPDINIAPPAQFGGPGDAWSPEDLLMAAVANCLVLSFKAVARASNLEWQTIECESVGELNRIDKVTRFTSTLSKVTLVIPETESVEKAERLLNKAEQVCLISNSLSCDSHIECDVQINADR